MVASVCLVVLFPLASACLSLAITEEHISDICLFSEFASTSTLRYLKVRKLGMRSCKSMCLPIKEVCNCVILTCNFDKECGQVHGFMASKQVGCWDVRRCWCNLPAWCYFQVFYNKQTKSCPSFPKSRKRPALSVCVTISISSSVLVANSCWDGS